MVRAAARFLVEEGPATQQERWEESSGFSPSTLASNVAALVVASVFARERGDRVSASYLEDYADYLNDHIEGWTVTTQGKLVPGIPRHYVRIRPADPANSFVEGPANSGTLTIPNHLPGAPCTYPIQEIVDAGFLELVKFGVRRPDDPIIAASVEVVDRTLKVETPFGPCWHRYNHDGYGETDEGAPFVSYGRGRLWPILTAERAQYQLALGKDVRELVGTLERFASRTGLLSEQIWDQPDIPKLHLHLGRPTTSAMPLVWSHSEYLKLLRSMVDGREFARLPEVERRYALGSRPPSRLEVWKPRHRPTHIPAGRVLRVQGSEPFRLHWSLDGWATTSDTDSTPTPLGLDYTDLSETPEGGRVVFTFYWPERGAWEGQTTRSPSTPWDRAPVPSDSSGASPDRLAGVPRGRYHVSGGGSARPPTSPHVARERLAEWGQPVHLQAGRGTLDVLARLEQHARGDEPPDDLGDGALGGSESLDHPGLAHPRRRQCRTVPCEAAGAGGGSPARRVGPPPRTRPSEGAGRRGPTRMGRESVARREVSQPARPAEGWDGRGRCVRSRGRWGGGEDPVPAPEPQREVPGLRASVAPPADGAAPPVPCASLSPTSTRAGSRGPRRPLRRTRPGRASRSAEIPSVPGGLRGP